MAPAGDTLIHAVMGLRLHILQAASDTGGALLAMEATYRAGNPEPPEHFLAARRAVNARGVPGVRDLVQRAVFGVVRLFGN